MSTSTPIAIASATLTGLLAAIGYTAAAADADQTVRQWLGSEFTVSSSTLEDHVPAHGKLTLVYDAEEDVYRACTRRGPQQGSDWQHDWTKPCGVAFTLVKSERFCTLDEVKAGNGETLAACHRFRSRDVAMHPGALAGSVELHDTLVFPLQVPTGAKKGIAILVDTPARMTHGGIVHAEC